MKLIVIAFLCGIAATLFVEIVALAVSIVVDTIREKKVMREAQKGESHETV